MTIWAKGVRGRGDYEDVLEQMQALQSTMMSPHDLIVLKTRRDAKTDVIFLALPNATLLCAFRGFGIINRDQIPDRVELLLCRRDGFEQHFPDIMRKVGYPI
jgi:hypothetical protein